MSYVVTATSPLAIRGNRLLTLPSIFSHVISAKSENKSKSDKDREKEVVDEMEHTPPTLATTIMSMG